MDFILLLAVFPIVIVGIVVVGIFIFRRVQRIEKQFRESAISLGATYWKGPANERGSRSLLLTESTQGTYISNLLIFPSGIEIGEANFTVSRGEHDATILFDFASQPFTKYSDLHLVVDSRQNNVLNRSLMETVAVDKKLEQVVLEGNFRDSYKVYMNAGKQSDALTALNPASMEKLMTFFDRYDMEICGGRVYIYTIGTAEFYKKEVRKRMMSDLENLSQIL